MQKHKAGFYEKYSKRILDFLLALTAIVILSPVILVTAVLVRMKLGSPVIFCQKRPGKDEKDENGNLLPDEARLTSFGKKLRATSLDELPELFNILKGDMSIVGPRPLLIKYLPRYNERQKHRHDVKPGLTGLAQVKGRNAISWEQKFEYDIEYTERVSLTQDLKIIFMTVFAVVNKKGISSSTSETMEEFMGNKE